MELKSHSEYPIQSYSNPFLWGFRRERFKALSCFISAAALLNSSLERIQRLRFLVIKIHV
jgi:hypothetical protein